MNYRQRMPPFSFPTLDEKLQFILYDIGIPPARLNELARLADDLGLDVIDRLILQLQLEVEFGLCILHGEWKGLTTFGQLQTFLRQRVGGVYEPAEFRSFL